MRTEDKPLRSSKRIGRQLGDNVIEDVAERTRRRHKPTSTVGRGRAVKHDVVPACSEYTDNQFAYFLVTALSSVKNGLHRRLSFQTVDTAF